MEEILIKMKKFVLKNSETRFQKAETRFQNAKTALSRIFFARPGMDSAQKKSLYGLLLVTNDGVCRQMDVHFWPLLSSYFQYPFGT